MSGEIAGFSGTAGVDEDGEVVGDEFWAGGEVVNGAVCGDEFAGVVVVVAGDAGVCALLPGLVAGGVRSCTGCWGGVEGCCEVGVCGVVDNGGAAGVCGVVCASACCCCAWAPMESVINSAAAMNEPFRSFIL